MTQRATGFEQNQERVLEQVQPVAQVALPLRSYNPADPMGLEMSW